MCYLRCRTAGILCISIRRWCPLRPDWPVRQEERPPLLEGRWREGRSYAMSWCSHQRRKMAKSLGVLRFRNKDETSFLQGLIPTIRFRREVRRLEILCDGDQDWSRRTCSGFEQPVAEHFVYSHNILGVLLGSVRIKAAERYELDGLRPWVRRQPRPS